MSSAKYSQYKSSVINYLRKSKKIALNTTKKIVNLPQTKDVEASSLSDGNTIINQPKLIKSKIVFHGKNNILFCEGDLSIVKSEIHFHGDNGLLYLSSNKNKRYHSSIFISHNSTVFIGQETRFNMGKSVDIHAADHKNVIIGRDCLFSWNPWIFTSDAHPVYDSNTGKRINYGRSVLIGDHVWIGKGVSILKGSVVGSGAIIGADSTLSGKIYNSNSSYVGSPAREIRKNVFFTKSSVKNSDTDTLEYIEEYPKDDFIYSYSKKEQLTLDEIDKKLAAAKTSTEKLSWVKDNLADNSSKNRFYINNNS